MTKDQMTITKEQTTMSTGTGTARYRVHSPRRSAGCPARLPIALAATLGAYLVLMLSSASSFAVTTHVFSTSFGGSGSGAGQLSNPQGVAVDQSTGDVYVADLGNERIDKFDASGHFIMAFGADVGGAGINTCTSSCGVGTSGSAPGQFTTPLFVAVDNSGGPSTSDIYVGDRGDSMVSKFNSSGSLITSWGSGGELNGASAAGGPFAGLAGIAVDKTGNLFVSVTNEDIFEFAQDGIADPTISTGRSFTEAGLGVDPEGNLYAVSSGVEKFSPTGAEIGKINNFNTTVTGFGLDPGTGDLYVDEYEGGTIFHYAFDNSGRVIERSGATCAPTALTSCEPTGTFSSSELTGVPGGVAVDSTSNTVYVADSAISKIDIFSAIDVPDVTTDPASNVEQTSTVLNGTVNPDGVQVTDCRFEYGVGTSYGASVPCSQPPASIGSGTSAVAVSANLTGLTHSVLYHFRLVASNANGSNPGLDETFVTAGLGFGIASFDNPFTNLDGTPDTQAGSHPYAQTMSLGFNATLDPAGNPFPDGQVKDIVVELPPGEAGDPGATPQCGGTEFASVSGCPSDTQVGVIVLTSALGAPGGGECVTGLFGTCAHPVYNMVPPRGMPAQFAFTVSNVPVHIDLSIRTGGDYGLTASLRDVSQVLPLVASSLTIWGVPADPSHDAQRCSERHFQGNTVCDNGGGPSGAPLKPLLRQSTTCSGQPQTTILHVDSWENPGAWKTASAVTHDSQGSPVGNDGCNELDFSPTFSATPDTTVADSPTGLAVDLHLPQNENPNGLAEADLKTSVVTLPQGLSISPSVANGLAACSPQQIELNSAAVPACPDASKIGTVEINTPALPNPLRGAVYVAQPYDNPFGSLLAIYVTAEDPVSGVLIKIAGHVVPDPVTGQLQAIFENTPQQPFSDFKLDFFGGPHAVLATPDACGSYTTTTALTPWSAPGSGVPATPSSSFAVESGCVGAFAPAFSAGTTVPRAGAYTPFVLSLSRSDSDQELAGLSTTLPAGLLANLTNVPLCSDAALAAASPSCPAGSQVGTVQTGVGPGSSPFFLPGKAYLAGPYKGAPYSLAVVVRAVAGPVDLGTVVVRVALRIDPLTAQAVAVSDPFPTILDGIPLRLRRVDVTLDRQGFMFNPSSCEAKQVAATLTSTGGLTASESSRFQVGGCGELAFKPSFTASTQGNGSFNGNGASLNVRVTAHQGPGSGEANIHKVELQLPRALPARLTTLQQACTEAQFAANPSGCPAASVIGTAVVHTPILGVALQGPAYLVSHGGAAFPDVVFVLQGGGIVLDLTGSTQIKHNITYSKFETVPDAPLASFETNLPEGPHSALATTAHLCANGRTVTVRKRVTRRVHGRLVHVLKKVKKRVVEPLQMPTTITAQNGTVLTQTTKIAVTGCARAATDGTRRSRRTAGARRSPRTAGARRNARG